LVVHELSIAQSIVDAVEKRATECQATRVKSVRLRIGEAIGIVTDSLTFCFEMLTGLEPMLAGAQLLIDIVPYRARCLHCGIEFPVVNFIAMCPGCEELSSDIVAGTELQILEMEIDVRANVSP
jgi:hydrogenase nickel incorporation protein HypA/HybF